ncbi:hypothetical protein AVEN_220655-1, partial [Araneus ventricosus]
MRTASDYNSSFNHSSTAFLPNLWYAYPWGYSTDLLGVRENNAGNGGRHE